MSLSADITCSEDAYNKNGTWYDYQNNSEYGPAIYAGDVDSSNKYDILLRFPLSGYANVTVTSANLYMERFCQTSTSAKTLTIRVVNVTSFDLTNHTVSYNWPDANILTWSITTGAGIKSKDITALMPVLTSSPSYYLLIEGASGNYTEFYALEKTGETHAHIAFAYNPPLRVMAGGTWRDSTAVKVMAGGAWRDAQSIHVVSGGVWRTVM